MPILSKYKNEQIEKLMEQILNEFESEKATVDLTLMVLGNLVTHTIKNHVPEKQQRAVCQQFSNALQSSLSQT